MSRIRTTRLIVIVYVFLLPSVIMGAPCTRPNIVIVCGSCPNYGETGCGGCAKCTKLIPGDYITQGGFLSCGAGGTEFCPGTGSNCSMCTLNMKYEVDVWCSQNNSNQLEEVHLCRMYVD